MKDNLTPVEIIGLAIRSEEEASAFYGHISKLVKNELVRSKYESLAREEGRHREMLVALYRKMTGEKGAPPKIPGDPATAEGGFPVENASIEDLLNFAIAREQEARRFYTKAAERTNDHTSKRMLEYLADIERGHETMLKSELDAYLRDKNWYAEHPDIQLV